MEISRGGLKILISAENCVVFCLNKHNEKNQIIFFFIRNFKEKIFSGIPGYVRKLCPNLNGTFNLTQ